MGGPPTLGTAVAWCSTDVFVHSSSGEQPRRNRPTVYRLPALPAPHPPRPDPRGGTTKTTRTSCTRIAECHPVAWRSRARFGLTHPTSFAMSAKGTIMNKLLKGSIAGAAGIVLLLGGAGTLAYWNDSANLTNAGSISSGVLNVEADAAAPGSWNNSISLIVPGDTRTFTQSLDLAATGDNLKF